MDDFTEKYLKYKKARDIQNDYFNFKNKGKLMVKCSNSITKKIVK